MDGPRSIKLAVVLLACVALVSAQRVYDSNVCNQFLQKIFRGSCEKCCVQKGFHAELSAGNKGHWCTCGKEVGLEPEQKIYFRETERNSKVCSVHLEGCHQCCEQNGFSHHIIEQGALRDGCTCAKRQYFSHADIKDQLEAGEHYESRPDVERIFGEAQ